MVPMTGVGTHHGFRGQKWFNDRVEIFKNYTLKSLIHQKNRAFLTWLTFRPQEKNNPLIEEIKEEFKKNQMSVLMTFDGLLYWDDKFGGGFKNIVKNTARLAREGWRNKTIRPLFSIPEIILSKKNKTIISRLEKSLYELSKMKEFLDASYIFVTRIDSDDMFHEEVVDEIQRVTPFEGALLYKNGYIYNSNTNEIAEWNPKTNPPFHTIVFLGSKFFNPVEHYRFYNGYHSHEDVPKCFKTKVLEDGRYCVVIHKNHISTLWNHPFRGKEVDIKKLNEFI
jgi:hypothetical protein